MIIQPHQFSTYSLRNSPHGINICKVLAAAINSVDAGETVRKAVHLDREWLTIEKTNYNLQKFKRIYVIGAGKASQPMVEAIDEILGDRINTGFIISPYKSTDLANQKKPPHVKVFVANHPIPDQRNINSGIELSALLTGIRQDDLVILLISGGGSALLTKPSPGIALQDIQSTTGLLLNSGAPINEINTVRKHLDDFKGGGLAKLLYPASVISLILSDVVGDQLDVIASGPTVPDSTTFIDAHSILVKYQIEDRVPNSVKERFLLGIQGIIPDTVKLGDQVFNSVSNIIIGSNKIAASAALKEAEILGYNSTIINTELQGEASIVGKEITEEFKKRHSIPSGLQLPTCLIAGGETTVTIKGTGKGGRNQELALGSVNFLAELDDVILISFATDGIDGPTDAAGAVVTNRTLSRGLALGLGPQDYLSRNDAYNYFKLLDDLLVTGPTWTNVNDLVLVFAS